ncbi:MAG: hypothetical protein M3Y53_03020 [Thermoproteota archaeon]|nr:hypothetical protein [Thermoproteota archaeon]
MSVDKPKFKETLWEWCTFGNRVDSNIRRKILRFPVRDDKSIKMQDHYLCRVGCDINIKIREEDLKVKSFHNKTYAGIEQWTTEAYGFPITAALFRSITKALKIEIPGRAIKDGKQLVSILSQAAPSVQVIRVQRRRELHGWPTGDGTTIELVEISTPEKVITISIEHRNLEKVSKALEYLQLPSPSMKVLNYVDSLKVWIEGKRLL